MTDDDSAGATRDQAARLIRPLVATIEGCAIDGGYEPPMADGQDLTDRVVDLLAGRGLLRGGGDTRDVEHPCKIRFCMECGANLTHQHRALDGDQP